MANCKFWLLDINYEVKENKPEIWIWGISEEGKRILIIDRNFLPYFYLVLDGKDNPQDVFERVQQQKTDLPHIIKLEPTRKNLFGKPVDVIKVYCGDPDLVPKYAAVLSKIKGVKENLEDDIRYSMRYFIDNNVTPCSWYEIEAEEKENNLGVQADQLFIAKSLPQSIEREDIPPLRVLAFSMICHGSKGMPKPDKDPVIIISTVTNDGEKKQFTAENLNDKGLIESFIEYTRRFDPDIVVGYGSGERDWQYLIERSSKLGLKLFVDRANTEPHKSVYAHMSITGRIHMDMLDYADELPEVKVKTLENVADFLGVMKLEERLIIDEVDFAEYWDDPQKRPQLLKFSMENVECIFGIFENMFDFAVQLSKLVALPLDQVGKAAVGFRTEWYLIREAYKIGELVPQRVERPYIPYVGGMVLKPKPGIHDNIALLDFKSMYPNIMIEHNVSPDTYIPPSETELFSDVNVAPEVGHKFRKEPPGFYKRVLSSLIAARDEIRLKMKGLDVKSLKYRLLDARQKAVKVITNACYGYAGWVGARWFMKPVAEATAAWGRNIIANAIKIAEDLGLNVIYGDTDSIFVTHDPEKIEKLSTIILDKFGLEIKPDKLYERILFTEAKKRYCGLLPNGKLDMVGLEVVRGDWANVAKNIQEHVLEIILKERSPKKAVEFVRQFIADLRLKKVPYKDLVIWKTITKPIDAYEVKTPHVAAAKILEKEGWTLTIGDKIGYVVTSGSGRLYNRVKPFALASYDEVDVEYYVTNQVVPAASRILSMFNIKEEELLSVKPKFAEPRTLSSFFGRS
ncbi:MAG: DNA polymerase domain-containing protein [Candidatus Bathyarchaeia archaeon]